MDNKVKLLSQENKILEVDVDIASKSSIIKKWIEDTEIEEEIPLPNVKYQILKKIMEYCEKHREDNPKEIVKPLKTSDMYQLVDENDAKFIDQLNLEELFEIIMAANYLDIRSLLDLSCVKVASLIKGQRPEDIRKKFQIKNDFTPEEEAQMKEDYQQVYKNN